MPYGRSFFIAVSNQQDRASSRFLQNPTSWMQERGYALMSEAIARRRRAGSVERIRRNDKNKTKTDFGGNPSSEKDVMSGNDQSEADTERAPITVPPGYQISVRGFRDEGEARKLANTIGVILTEISRMIDISSLDGVTIAYDYEQALLDLDRGYETAHKLTPSSGDAVGVAMTPAVIRDGMIKSHIVLHAGLAEKLGNPEQEEFKIALHALAHECAHVEVTNRFDRAFPQTLLRPKHETFVERLKWDVILACWDEYAVCCVCAGIGEDRTEDYENVLSKQLAAARDRANEAIRAYRQHGVVDTLLVEVFGIYGNLMKFASYYSGNLHGLGLAIDQQPFAASALAGHWFEPHFYRLVELCDELFAEYGGWQDKESFEKIGRLAETILAEGGVFITPMEEGHYINVPFTFDTMP